MEKVDYIQYLCEKKMLELGVDKDQRYIAPLERELANVAVQGIADYVLSLVNSKTKADHPSLMYYLLGISEDDPIISGKKVRIKKNASFPDIDADFSDGKDRVVEYFIDKYGKDRVACIGAYGQAKIKMVLRDIARIFDISLAETNDMAKALADDVDELPEAEFNRLIALGPNDEGFREDLYNLGQYLERHPEIKDILFQLKGQLRHLTKHPAGVVAVPTDIDETIPLMRHKGEMITSWVDGVTRKDLQMSGFIKFDILGLKTLTIIKDVIDLIRASKMYNPDADFDLASIEKGQMTSIFYDEFSTKLKVNGNDAIYTRFRDADTNGIFQFECISGETWIGNFRMKEVYERFMKGDKTLQVNSINLRTKERIRQPILAMKKQRRPLRRVMCEGGISIDATDLHKFYTQYKWSELKDLKAGDKILFDFKRKRTQYACESCDDHIDHAGVCKNCFAMGDRMLRVGKKRERKNRYGFIEIEEIRDVGEADVYDLAVERFHNYIANGFIVHNSRLMKQLLKDIKPTGFNDITASTALARPGPLRMGMHKEFAARKNGKKFEFGHPLIEQVLKDTQGVIVYQEDVMKICNIVAGFPLDLTDSVRKNLMKKTRDTENVKKSKKERGDIESQFLNGCLNNGLTAEVATELWNYCVKFSEYGFNKAHAAAYTLLSYQMMWLKHYYPLEFMVTLFSHSDKEKFTHYFSEAMNLGIKIIPTDINKASRGFSIHREGDQNYIMFGLAHIMGLGPAVIDIIEETKPFRSFKDFITRTSVSRKIPKQAIEALINAHAFDCFGTQNQIIEEYYLEVRDEKTITISKETGKRVKTPWQRDFDYNDKLYEHEKFVETYSLDWRINLTPRHKTLIKSHKAKSLVGVADPDIYLKKRVWGIITEITEKKSKSGNRYLYVMLTDAKFNTAKVRVPLYNRRAKMAWRFSQSLNDYEKVPTGDVMKLQNIIVCEVEASEFMERVFVDAFDIYCVGHVYEKSGEQNARIQEAIGSDGDRELEAVNK